MDRLASMVSSANHETETRCVHDTIVGAFIVYDPNGLKIQLFENINGKGKNTALLDISKYELLNGRIPQEQSCEYW